MIHKIRIGSLRHKDNWIWSKHRGCNFRVRSAYKFFNNLQRELRGESSLTQDHNFMWRKLWHLKHPSKIKKFTWGAFKDSLPYFKNPCSKKIVKDMNCKLCNQPVEDLSHALLFCTSICI